MENEFIPYEQALVLKELGFDEPCFGYCLTSFKKDVIKEGVKGCVNSALEKNEIALPLYQQTFRFFREKYGLFIEFPTIHLNSGWKQYKGANYSIIITEISQDIVTRIVYDDTFNTKKDTVREWLKRRKYKTHEQAELECLKKLIEICQQTT